MLDQLFRDKDLAEPKDLDREKILSRTKQWDLRKQYERGEPGGLPHIRVGKKVFYDRRSLEEWFEQKQPA